MGKNKPGTNRATNWKKEVELDKPYPQEAHTTRHETGAHREASGKKEKKHLVQRSRSRDVKIRINDNYGKSWKHKPKTMSGGKDSLMAYALPGSEKA